MGLKRHYCFFIWFLCLPVSSCCCFIIFINLRILRIILSFVLSLFTSPFSPLFNYLPHPTVCSPSEPLVLNRSIPCILFLILSYPLNPLPSTPCHKAPHIFSLHFTSLMPVYDISLSLHRMTKIRGRLPSSPFLTLISSL